MRDHWNVFLISAAVLLFQILLTRLFSLVFSYHYTFLGVSVALCGLGLGGALVALPRLGQRALLPRYGLLFGLGIGTTLALLLGLPNSESALLPAGFAALAFVAAGASLALVLRHGGAAIGGLYAASLAGSALGCAVVFPLLGALGGPHAVLATALLAVVAGLLGAARGEWTSWRLWGPGSVIVAFVGWGWVAWPAAQVGGASGKEFAEARLNYTPFIEASRWSGFARTDLVVVSERPDEKILYTDGAAPAPLLRWSGEPNEIPSFDDFVGALPFRMQTIDRALVLGSGGGRDVLVALAHGVREITAVEVNPDMVALVREQTEFGANVYDHPGVELAIAEARSFLRSTADQWDLVYISLPRSQRSANLAGYQLVENYLLTSEALDDYFAHLRPAGQLAIVAYSEADMLKLFGMLMERARRAGVDEGEALRRLAIFRQPNLLGVMRYLLVARARPFTVREIAAAGRLHGVDGVELQLLSNRPGGRPLRTGSLLESLCVQVLDVGIETWIRELSRIQKVDLSPATDERPFFYKWKIGIPTELKQMAGAALVPVLALWLLVWYRQRRSALVDHHEGGAWLLYFSGLGAGYVLIEIGLVHKTSFFLGAPSYSLAVTLGTLLLGGSLGSHCATRWRLSRAPVCLAVVGAALVVWLGLSPLLGAALGWPLPARCVLAALVVLPLGYLMGMPFPLGMARLAEGSAHRIPWAWAVNGLVSVVGSVAAVMIAMRWGFSITLLAGACAYLAALAAAKLW